MWQQGGWLLGCTFPFLPGPWFSAQPGGKAEQTGCWEWGQLTHPKLRQRVPCFSLFPAMNFHTWTSGVPEIHIHAPHLCSVVMWASWWFPLESIRKVEGINKIIKKFLSIIICFLQIQLLLEPPARINDMENMKGDKQRICELGGIWAVNKYQTSKGLNL